MRCLRSLFYDCNICSRCNQLQEKIHRWLQLNPIVKKYAYSDSTGNNHMTIVSLTPGVSSRLARTWRLVLCRFAPASHLALLAPGLLSCFACPRFLVLSCSLPAPASCLVSRSPNVLSRLAHTPPQRLVLSCLHPASHFILLAPSVLSCLARHRRLVPSCSPPAFCLVSLAPSLVLLAPGVSSRLVLLVPGVVCIRMLKEWT